MLILADMVTLSHSQTEISAELRRLGGLGLVIGNAAIFAHGLLDALHGDKSVRNPALWRMGGALMWAGGGVIGARYGKEPLDKQFGRLQAKLTEHLELSGAKLDEALREEFLAGKPKGLAQKLESFAYNYPTEVMAVYNTLAAGTFVQGGLKHRRHGTSVNATADIGMGACIMASSLVAALLPEKNEEQLRREGVDPDSLIGWAQRRPMAIANTISMAGNVAAGYGAYKEIMAGKKLGRDTGDGRHLLILGTVSALATAFFVGGNLLFASSSKKTSGKRTDRETTQQKMIESAASLLAAQPLETQQSLAESAAYYLTKQPELRMSELNPAELKEKILESAAKAAEKIAAQGHSR